MADENGENKGSRKKRAMEDAAAKERIVDLDEEGLRIDPSILKYADSIAGVEPYVRAYVDEFNRVRPYVGTFADNLGRVELPIESIADPSLARRLTAHTVQLEQDLEDRIGELRQENKKLRDEVKERKQALEKKEIETGELEKSIGQLKKNQEEIARQQRLQYLFYKVHPAAWERLKSDEAFRKRFYRETPCPMFIMSIDIRKSTELMLNAKDPRSYQGFIITLCTQLKQIILENYGVFDKFTGDGILAFFPQFYSGEDAAYCVIKAAAECHAFFSSHYRKNRGCFTVIMKDIGLGIGIDFGETQLVNVQDWLTVIGTPVVYACRLSSVEAGRTLLNQRAYDEASRKFGEFLKVQEYEQPFKHQGTVVAYAISLAEKTPTIKPPDWLENAADPNR
jgi:class 3 adenylate cyclase